MQGTAIHTAKLFELRDMSGPRVLQDDQMLMGN